MQVFEVNPILRDIFGPAWIGVRFIVDDAGVRKHMAHDICARLGITNVSTAIRGINGQDRVELENRDKELVPEWNAKRRVHFLTLAGVYQLILNNNPRRSQACKVIRSRIGNYLARAERVSLVA